MWGLIAAALVMRITKSRSTVVGLSKEKALYRHHSAFKYLTSDSNCQSKPGFLRSGLLEPYVFVKF